MRAHLVIASALALFACERVEAPREEPSAPSDASAMCAEHGVLDALCTICNPALVPVFRARGDYCEEHRLPESICPICHPERGGRPAVDVSAEAAPADGTRVRLASRELADRIGIAVQEATRAPAVREVVATARVAYDPTRLARVNPRSPGVIRAIHADVGARVSPGDALVTIASADVGADRTRIAAARTRLEVAEASVARREGLSDVVSQREILAARQERDSARAELAALQASLGIVGGGRGRGSEYTLSAPIAGVVTRRAGTIGAYVETGEVLVQIVDASRVWIELDVPEDEVARVAAGQSVIVTMDALGDRTFEGDLAYLAPEIDPHTRTALGRIALDNLDGVLRANMFGRGRVQVPRTDDAAVLVPRAAVQRARGAALVFVRIAPELYEVRRVEVLERAADPANVEVRGRVEPGDDVVVEGAFLLRTETVSDSIGAGCCEGEE